MKILWPLQVHGWRRQITPEQTCYYGSNHELHELDHKEGWTLKNWCFWNVVLEKTLESYLGSKEIKLGNPKGNQPWIFIGRTDAEVEASLLCPPNVKSQLIGKDPDAGKDWVQEEKKTKDEMDGWHHWLNGHELEQTLADSEGQGSLVCCSPWALQSRTRLSNWTTASSTWKLHYRTSGRKGLNRPECIGRA